MVCKFGLQGELCENFHGKFFSFTQVTQVQDINIHPRRISRIEPENDGLEDDFSFFRMVILRFHPPPFIFPPRIKTDGVCGSQRPKAKLIVLLRNPIGRAVSHHNHDLSKWGKPEKIGSDMVFFGGRPTTGWWFHQFFLNFHPENWGNDPI